MNPTITIMMNTSGLKPTYIEEAIQSILDQQYQDFILQITCIHPDGLHLTINDPRIIIYNIDKFIRFPSQITWSLKQIKTDYWCVVDSDDYILPEHLQNLVNNIFEVKNEKKLMCVRSNSLLMFNNLLFTRFLNGGWTRSLYETMNKKRILQALFTYKMCKNKRVENGFDTQIRKMMFWEIKDIPGTTYMYRYETGFHVSKHSNRPLEIPKTSLKALTPQYYNKLEKLCRAALLKGKGNVNCTF